MSDDVIRRFREQIADRDRAILEAVNARLRLVAELRRYKTGQRIEFVDPDQESRVVAALEAANPGPLSTEGVRRLWAELLALTKRELGEPR